MNLLLVFAAVFYPLLGNLWEQDAPLTPERFDLVDLPPQISDAVLREQSISYFQLSNADLRTDILRDLRNAYNPAAVKILFSMLKKETRSSLQADILASILAVIKTEKMTVPKEPALRRYLASDHPSVRIHAAELLLRGRYFQDAVLDMLTRETDPAVPLALTDVLCAAAADLPAAELRTMAGAALPETRRSAIRLLAMTAKNPDSDALLIKAASDKNVLLRTALAAGLADNPAGDSLLQKAASSGDVPVRFASAAATPTNAARTKLLGKLTADTESALIRARAAESLRNTPNAAHAIAALTAALRDTDPLVRETAGVSLGTLAESKLPPDVLAAANHKDSRYAVLLAIRVKADPRYAGLVEEFLKNAGKDDRLRILALDLLARQKAVRAIDTMAKLTESTNPDVRAALASAFGDFPRDAGTIATLKKLAVDPQEKVCLAAIESIRRNGSAEFADTLAGLIGNTARNAFVRAAAAHALHFLPGPLSQKALNAIHKITQTACIRVPQAPPVFDAPESRAACLMTLYAAAARGDAKAKKLMDSMLAHLNAPTQKEKDEGFLDDTMQEYVRQVTLLSQGKRPEAKEKTRSEPELTVQKIKR